MSTLKYLERAEKYAEARGDTDGFLFHYNFCRESFSIQKSVWLALRWLYDEETANLLQQQYWEPAL